MKRQNEEQDLSCVIFCAQEWKHNIFRNPTKSKKWSHIRWKNSLNDNWFLETDCCSEYI